MHQKTQFSFYPTTLSLKSKTFDIILRIHMDSACFQLPTSVAVSPIDGRTVFVSDSCNHRIRVIRDGNVSTLAGDGNGGYLEGPGAQAQFQGPAGIAVSPDGVVYVSDNGNDRIRMIHNGLVTNFAGSDSGGYVDGPADQAKFLGPAGLAFGPDGALYIADEENHRIRMIKNGLVATVAGSGEIGFKDGPANVASFFQPCDVAVGADGSIYVADFRNNAIRMIRDGQVTTVAGKSDRGFLDGDTSSALFYRPSSVALGSDNTLYIAERGNHRIRMIQDGQVSTLAGNGSAKFVDGPTRQACFFCPAGIAIASDGTIYIADSSNERIRFILKDRQRVGTLAGCDASGFADGPCLNLNNIE